MHKILSGYFSEELQQRMWVEVCMSREGPIGSCSVIPATRYMAFFLLVDGEVTG